MLDLSVVIVNYNAGGFLLRCLDSIAEQTFSGRWETIVVDNASTDGSLARARARFPFVRTVAHAHNLGFARGVNAGLAIAGGRYLLLLNPDTRPASDACKRMVEFMDDHPDAGLAGGRVLNPDGSLQFACRRNIPTPGLAFLHFTGLVRALPGRLDVPEYKITRLDPETAGEVAAVSGAFMAIRHAALAEVGRFDERFFMYGEDLDYCYRMGRAGWSIYYNPRAVVVHYLGVSSATDPARARREFYRAMWLFYQKHYAAARHPLLNQLVRGGIVALRALATVRSLGVRRRRPAPIGD